MAEIQAPQSDSGATSGQGDKTREEVLGASVNAAGGIPQVKRSFMGSGKKAATPLVVIIAAVGAVGLFAIMFHHPKAQQQTATTQQMQPSSGAPTTAASAAGNTNNLPTDQQAPPDQSVNNQDTSPADIQHTRGQGQTGGQNGQPLSSIQDFSQQPQVGTAPVWTPPTPGQGPPAGTSGAQRRSNNQGSIRLAQVSKPSITFVLGDQSSQAHLAGSGASGLTSNRETAEPQISNLGFQPGFHVVTHLESAACTAIKAPVIAVVDYDYRRHGAVIIPAGSRMIGAIEEASSTGIMGIHFSSIHLLDGEDIPVSAIGLDQRMSPLKGTVTGRNRGKQFLLAALSGMGSATAMFAGNNVNGSLSEADMMRNQTAQNMGQAADTQIQQLEVSQHLIVTVPAGTQVEVTFTAPAKQKNGQQ